MPHQTLLSTYGRVAQWIGSWTLDPKIAGSTPATIPQINILHSLWALHWISFLLVTSCSNLFITFFGTTEPEFQIIFFLFSQIYLKTILILSYFYINVGQFIPFVS